MNRNYFGRQTESFETELALPFLVARNGERESRPFNGIFIRAPVVEKLLPVVQGEQTIEKALEGMIIAPSEIAEGASAKLQVLRPVEIMAILPGRSRTLREKVPAAGIEDEIGDIVAVKQGNVFGSSFHPELTQDARIHVWWLEQVRDLALPGVRT